VGADPRRRFRQFFGDRRPVLLSVIPVTADRATLDQVVAARKGGADGVFLIGDGVGHQKVLRTARLAVERHPDFFVGVNCPDLRPQDVFCRIPAGISGVWSYRPGIWPPDPDTLAATAAARHDASWQGLHFGSMDETALRINMTEFTHALATAAAAVDVITIELRYPGISVGATAVEKLRTSIDSRPVAVAIESLARWGSEAPTSADCILAPAAASACPGSLEPAETSAGTWVTSASRDPRKSEAIAFEGHSPGEAAGIGTNAEAQLGGKRRMKGDQA
jgi:hypothetical protein